MTASALLDRDAVARACVRHGVARLRLFGSAASDRFDALHSDFDFFVEFRPNVDDLLGNYLQLQGELEEIAGRPVDLVMPDAVENPYFAADAFSSTEEICTA